MRTTKLKLNFFRYTDSGFETKAQLIVQSMTGNTHFPNPLPTMAELEAAIQAYSVTLVNAAGLGRINVAEKNQSREELELLLAQLGLYVMYISMGDVAMLTSSGFDLTKDPEPSQLTNPGNVTLRNGITTGEMTASVKAVRGARSYLHEYTSDPILPESEWESTPSSRSKLTFQGLEAGKKYWVRIAVLGAGEQIAYSPLASMFVQ
jgi:hypothetical protein